MNILPKKKWHVRTKENVARVRRDEAKAAADEKARTERVAIAEHEDRLRRLKTKPTTDTECAVDIFTEFRGASSANFTIASSSGHVNLFSEIEQQERKNLKVGNKEYEVEKKKEKDDWESKMGIMKRFAEDTKEYSKERYWWEDIPIIRENSTSKAKTKGPTELPASKKSDISEPKLDKNEVEVSKKNKHKKRRHDSSSDDEEAKKTKLAKLRQERLAREQQERVRTEQLLKGCGVKKEPVEKKSQLEEDRTRTYSNKFNPNFAKK